jgi:hypothetical protein
LRLAWQRGFVGGDVRRQVGKPKQQRGQPSCGHIQRQVKAASRRYEINRASRVYVMTAGFADRQRTAKQRKARPPPTVARMRVTCGRVQLPVEAD